MIKGRSLIAFAQSSVKKRSSISKAVFFCVTIMLTLIIGFSVEHIAPGTHYAVAKPKAKAHKVKKKRPSRLVKKGAKSAASLISNTANVYYKDRFAVLTYHNIGSQENTYTISPERLAKQLDTLRSLGYNFIPLGQACAFLDGKASLPPNALVVTFDDGTDGFYHYAYPILKARRIPASMFVIVGYVGKGFNGLQCLTWQQMQDMQKDGYTFYSHTYDSHNRASVEESGTLTIRSLVSPANGESSDDFKARVRDDLTKSKTLLEANLGRPVEYLALPYGMANNDAIKIAQEVGFSHILTVHEDLNSARIPATYVYRFNAGSPFEDGYSIHKRIIAKAPPKPEAQKKITPVAKVKKISRKSKSKSRTVKPAKGKKKRR